MEPESHRLDREALLRDRLTTTERIRGEVDEAVTAAAERRRTYLDGFIDRMRFEAHVQQLRDLQQPPPVGAAPDEEPAGRPPAAPRHAEAMLELSRTQVARAPLERAVSLDTQAEREHAAPAETQERRGPSERTCTRGAMTLAPGTDIEHSPEQLALDLYGDRVPGDEPPVDSPSNPDGETSVVDQGSSSS